MRIGVLTGGGDCPGLNAVIRAVVRKGVDTYGHEFVGFRDGWRGPLEGLTRPLNVAEVRGILPRGGTILGSSRTNPFKIDGGVERIKSNLAELGIDALVAIGGEDTLGVATNLDELGVKVVGVPKTIDNDLGATDYTFGFDTAVNIAMEAIDRLHTTAESHHRTLVVEVMGRHAGWIALHAEGAQPLEGQMVTQNQELDAFGHVRLGGIGQWLAESLEAKTGKEARTVVLGHIQRGGTPTAFDRVLATRFGLHAIDAVHEGDFGKMVALRSTDIARVPLVEATRELKTVPIERYTEAEVFFGS
jgi:6-phosphofructokinase